MQPQGEGDKEYWDVVGDFTNKSLKLKPERWAKALQAPDTKRALVEFLDEDAPQVLVCQNASNQLVAQPDVPGGLRTKAVYFLKTSDVQLERESEEKSNVREHVIFGDVSPQPLDQLSTLIEEVLIPILENPANRDGWPEMVAEDVSRQLYSLRGTVYRMWGQLRGQTLLPLPFGKETLEKAERHALETGEISDSQLKSAMEGVVIKWVHQVDEVLRQDTSELAADDHYPTPCEEIIFWSKRRENLNHISQQLMDKKVLMMSNILEATESAYYPAFMKMVSDVRMGVSESRDIMIYLTPLKPLLEALDATEYTDALPLLAPLLHCICILWACCPAYRKPDRIVTLFKEITNQLITMGRNFMGTVGFQSETSEPLQKLDTCSGLLIDFKKCFEEYKEKVATYFEDGSPPRHWEFHPSHSFARMEKFLNRLNNIKEIFLTAKEFLKIEKIEFGGPKGKVLGSAVASIFSEFNEAYTAFSIRTYDCLDPKEIKFDEAHNKFNLKVTDLEQRLSLVVNHALQESQSPEAYFKVVELLGTMIQRPILYTEFTICLPHLLNLLTKEVTAAKDLFERYCNQENDMHESIETDRENSERELDRDDNDNEDSDDLEGVDEDYFPRHKFFPGVVGRLKRQRELLDRVHDNMSSFSSISHPIVESEEGISLIRQWNDLSDSLKAAQKAVDDEWRTLASADYSGALRQPLLRRRKDKALSVNFSPQLVRAMAELKYVWVLGPDVREGQKIAALRGVFRHYTANLQLVVDWYNHILKNTSKVELSLIQGELTAIDVTIKMAEGNLTWNSNGGQIGEGKTDVQYRLAQLIQQLKYKKCKNIKIFRTYEAI